MGNLTFKFMNRLMTFSTSPNPTRWCEWQKRGTHACHFASKSEMMESEYKKRYPKYDMSDLR